MTQEQLTEKAALFAKYLAYGVEIETENVVWEGNPPEPSHNIFGYTTLTTTNFDAHLNAGFRIILRPLESLTEWDWDEIFKPYTVGGTYKINIDKLRKEKLRVFLFDPYDGRREDYVELEFKNGIITLFNVVGERYEPNILDLVESLYKLHVDIHGAIGKGWALDKTKQ